MTIREKIVDLLVDRLGDLLVDRFMFEQDAKKVVQDMIDDPAFEKNGMAGRWDDSAEGNAPFLIEGLFLHVRQRAVAHVEATCPEAFYLPILRGH